MRYEEEVQIQNPIHTVTRSIYFQQYKLCETQNGYQLFNNYLFFFGGLVSYLSKIPIHHTCTLDFRRWIPQIDGREPANVATHSLLGAAACLHYYEPSLRPWAPARFPAARSRSQRLVSRALVIVHFPLLTGRSPPAPKHPPPSLPLCL